MKKHQPYLFALSIVCHALLLTFFSIVWLFPSYPEKKPSLYIPSYTYDSRQTPAPTPSQSSAKQEELSTSKATIKQLTAMAEQQIRNIRSINQLQAVATSNKYLEGVHLVGDKGVPKPLIKLLAKALASRLVYPKSAIDFNVHGTVLVGFSIHPDGQVSHIQLVQSSGANVLDNAAIAGVNAMSPIKDVSQYLNKAEFLVVGVIFG